MVRQISNLFRIMKSVVWRQKSNMIKKQDSSFSYKGDFFSHRTHRSNRTHLRTVLNSQKAFGIQISQSVSAKGGCKVLWNRLTWCLCGMLRVLFFCVFLWEKERTLSTRLGLWDLLRSFISHRAHRVHGAFWRTVSSPQKASGIQSTQSVTAKVGCKVLWNRLT